MAGPDREPRPYLEGDPPDPCADGRHYMRRAPENARAWLCDRCGYWRAFHIDGDQPDERQYKALLAERYASPSAMQDERDAKEAP